MDHELLGWLRTSLDRNRELRITVGYGIDRDAVARRQDTRRAIKRRRFGGSDRWARGRRVAFASSRVGNTHEKIVICDDRYVILTSFNFLSFNPKPGKGLTREMGYRITDAAIVADVRARIARVLLR